MKTTARWVLIAVVAAGAFWLGRDAIKVVFDQTTEAEIADALTAAIDEINAKAPITLDDITTLVSASASGVDVTYTNKISVSATQMGNDFEATQRKSLQAFVCQNKEMMITLDHGGSFTYAYIDPDGMMFASIRIAKSDCSG